MSRLYEFDKFRVLPDERLLLRDGLPFSLPPRVFDTLVLFIERRGGLLTRAELQKALWPDTFVEENALTKNISDLRKALGEDAEGRPFVETVPKSGYRFVAPVVEMDAPSIAPPRPATTQADAPQPVTSRRGRLIVAALLSLAAVGWGFWSLRPSLVPQPIRIRSLAILPFRPMSAQARDEYLELGMADTLIARLSAIGEVAVRPTSAVREFAGDSKNAMDAARRLGVDAVLEGSLQNLNGLLRVNARLIRVSDGSLLWSASMDQRFENLFLIQDSLANQIAQALSLHLTAAGRGALTKSGTSDARAYEAYERGRFFAAKRTAEGYSSAIASYREAIGMDPRYALAWSGLADAYMLSAGYDATEDRPSHELGREAALRAVELDGALAEGHTSLALVRENADWDFRAAESEYERALSLNPNYVTAHHWYGELLGLLGHSGDGLTHLERAHELDPLSLIVMVDTAKTLMFAGRYQEALGQCKRALELDPSFARAHGMLQTVYRHAGMYAEARAELDNVSLVEDTAGILGTRGLIYGLSEQPDKARDDLRQLRLLAARQRVPPYTIALIYMGLRDADNTMEWLEKAYQEHSEYLVGILVEKELDPFRNNPRFQSLLRKMNFP